MKPWRTHPRGWALPTVMALLGLTALSALSLTRGLWLHASLLRSDGDEWRARLAAEALLRDAEQDLQASTNLNSQDTRHSTPGTDPTPLRPFIPQKTSSLALLQKVLAPGLCMEGICAPLALEQATATQWLQRFNTGARYGQFTRNGAIWDSRINPVLADRSAYWLEAFASADANQTMVLWRITALAQATPQSSPIVLQAWWQASTDAPSGGRRLSWHEVLP